MTFSDENLSFKNIDRIVMRNSNEEEYDLIYLNASNKDIVSLGDINEYGWKFIVDKLKYNQIYPLDFLPDAIKLDVVGTDLNSISAIEKTFFPTIATGHPEVNNIRYFGTVSINNDQKLLMIVVPPGYSSIEFFDTSSLTDSEIITDDYDTTEDNDVDASEIDINNVHITSYEPKIGRYLFSEEEQKWYKLIWFVICPDKTRIRPKINISYIAWENSINPKRNLHQYLLRQDDKAEIDAYSKVVDNINDSIWLDTCSNTLLGTKVVENHPIIDNKLSKAEEWDPKGHYTYHDIVVYDEIEYISLSWHNKGNNPKTTGAWTINYKGRSNFWNKSKFYKTGDKITWGRQVWVSIHENIGENPLFSNCWILESVQNQFSNNRRPVNIKLISGTGDTTIPGTSNPSVITIPRSINGTTVEVILTPGYYIPRYISGYNQVGRLIDYTSYSDDTTIFYDIYKNKNKTCSINFSKRSIEQDQNQPTIFFKKVINTVNIYDIENPNQIITGITNSFNDSTNGTITDSNSKETLIENPVIVQLLDANYSTKSINKIVERYKIYNRVIEERELTSGIINNGKAFSFTIKYPADVVEYYLDFISTTFRVEIINHVGFYISSLVETVQADGSCSFYISRINRDGEENMPVVSVYDSSDNDITNNSNYYNENITNGNENYYILQLSNIKTDLKIKIQ